jgi:hypothetical protein
MHCRSGVSICAGGAGESLLACDIRHNQARGMLENSRGMIGRGIGIRSDIPLPNIPLPIPHLVLVLNLGLDGLPVTLLKSGINGHRR